MEEEWKQIVDYPNYSVSNYGNIRNDKTGLILKAGLDNNGYKRVGLYNNGKPKTFEIHKLVGEAFIEKSEENIIIDHIDRDKLNNNVSNLRFVTYQINSRNRTKNKNCSSIYKGVYWKKQDKIWEAKIKIDRKDIYLGRYKTEIEAGASYNNYITNNNLIGFVLNELKDII
jgi:hypothetical protein